MKPLLLGLATITALHAGGLFAGTASAIAWPGITVKVLADRPVDSTTRLREDADGFHRLEITLSNKGQQTLTIEKITVRIPLAERLTDDLEILYGGSSMGRTPVLRQNIGSPTKLSSSHMFQMLRLTDGEHLFAGSLSWRVFMPNFTLKDGAFEVWSHGEGKQLKPGETIQYEQIVLTRSADWSDLLGRFGAAIATANGIPRPKDVDFKGWATWDYYGFVFSAADIHGNVAELKKIAPAANLVQIDAGWFTERGDFTTVRPDLPGGIKEMAGRIKAAGLMPGLWIDGYRADTKSEIFKKHPEFFLRDQDDKIIVDHNKNKAWNHVFFDYSHPGARAYMAECIRVIRQDWGIPYFKIDFMRYGLNQEIRNNIPSLRQVKAHDQTITDVERMRLGLQAMRDAVGPDNYLLGCSAVFGPCIGFVDGMRTAGDINPNFVAFGERVLGNAGNFYLQKVFNVDPDYLVFRAADDEDEKVSKDGKKSGGSLTLNEAAMWGDFVSLFGNCRLSSDNLMSLRPERQALVKEVFKYPAMDETVPLDLWQHAKNKFDGFELLLARKGPAIYLGIFNWGDAAKEYPLPAFGKAAPVVLAGRHSIILKYEGNASFTQLRQDLQNP
jgi:alpha-galactosidase